MEVEISVDVRQVWCEVCNKPLSTPTVTLGRNGVIEAYEGVCQRCIDKAEGLEKGLEEAK